MDRIFQLHLFILICLALALLTPAQTFAQSSREKAWLEAIPAPQRTRLLKRFKLYVEYARKSEYGKLYDMFSKETIHPRYAEAIGNVYATKTRDTYVQYYKSHYPKVLNFKPQSLKESRFGDYAIRGEATLLDKDGHKSKEERVLFLWLESGDWYFSEFNEETSEIWYQKDGPPQIKESSPPL